MLYEVITIVDYFDELLYQNTLPNANRITSYNVCYTKLLRVSLELLTKNDCSLCDIAKATLDKVLPDYPGVRLSTTDIETDAQLFATYKEKIPVLSVITSYSIHYTKLYDKEH